ncbi:unnamed protein product [Larinioides sclopetarius]|uniref:NADH dehydrogenase subunit 5 n=1 Tax=Larinioides sclopetarius TaxID=280406 RepID=A0AAV2ANG8_9ARAC
MLIIPIVIVSMMINLVRQLFFHIFVFDIMQHSFTIISIFFWIFNCLSKDKLSMWEHLSRDVM